MRTNKYKAICFVCQKVVNPGEGSMFSVRGSFSIIHKVRHITCKPKLKSKEETK